MYRTKEQILSSTVLLPTTKIMFKSQYLQYSDDFKAFWSVTFESDADREDLLKYIKDKCDLEQSSEEPDAKEPHGDEFTKDPIELGSMALETIEEIPKDKSSIVSRVAKLGRQLPILAAGDLSDSPISPDVQQSRAFVKPNVKRESLVLATTAPSGVSVAYQTTTTWPSMNDLQNLNNHFSETRVQNAEMRMSASKLESKLDRVLDKIDLIRAKSALSDEKEDEILQLEEKVLELKKENRSLKAELKLATEQRQPEIQQPKVDEINEKEDELRAQAEVLRKEIEDKSRMIKQLEDDIETVKAVLVNERAVNTSKTNEAEGQTARIAQLEADVKAKDEKIAALEQENQAASAKNAEKIRGIMNDFYGKFYEQVKDRELMTASEILKLTVEIVRRETKSALNQ